MSIPTSSIVQCIYDDQDEEYLKLKLEKQIELNDIQLERRNGGRRSRSSSKKWKENVQAAIGL